MIDDHLTLNEIEAIDILQMENDDRSIRICIKKLARQDGTYKWNYDPVQALKVRKWHYLNRILCRHIHDRMQGMTHHLPDLHRDAAFEHAEVIMEGQFHAQKLYVPNTQKKINRKIKGNNK